MARSRWRCLPGFVGLLCVSYIAEKKPKAFMLENVPMLASHKHWSDFCLIMNFLMSIRGDDGIQTYRLSWKIVDALDCGLPQSRPRLYVVGVQKEKPGRAFLWPPVVGLRPLSEFLDDDVVEPPVMPSTLTQQRNYLKCVETILKRGHTLRDQYIADLGDASSLNHIEACCCRFLDFGKAPGWEATSSGMSFKYQTSKAHSPFRVFLPEPVGHGLARSPVHNEHPMWFGPK